MWAMAARARFTSACAAHVESALRLPIRILPAFRANLRRSTKTDTERTLEYGLVMAETDTAPQNAQPPRNRDADKEVFTQVEKWMALIREIARDPSGANR
jgi:hypothetical protein